MIHSLTRDVLLLTLLFKDSFLIGYIRQLGLT